MPAAPLNALVALFCTLVAGVAHTAPVPAPSPAAPRAAGPSERPRPQIPLPPEAAPLPPDDASAGAATVPATFHLQRSMRGVRRLQVHSVAGDVRVRAQRGEQLVVDGARTLGGTACAVRLSGGAKTLQLTASDPTGRPCAIELQVRLPQNAQLDIEATAGNVFVSGARAALQLQLTQGNAVVGGSFPAFTAKLERGSLSVQGLAGEAHIEVEQGNLQLFVDPEAATGPIAVDFRVGRGNVTFVSPLAAAAVQVHSAAGEVRSSLEDGGPNSKVRVQGELEHGSFQARRGQ